MNSSNEEEKPPRLKLRITSAPKIRQVLWCSYPKDAQLPEFWKKRPVIVISRNTPLYGPCTVIPTTTFAQPANKFAYPLSDELVKGKISWAVCNHISTIATSRLEPFNEGVIRVSEDDFAEVLSRLYDWLPQKRLPLT